jgi:hypothetical protein
LKGVHTQAKVQPIRNLGKPVASVQPKFGQPVTAVSPRPAPYAMPNAGLPRLRGERILRQV